MKHGALITHDHLNIHQSHAGTATVFTVKIKDHQQNPVEWAGVTVKASKYATVTYKYFDKNGHEIHHPEISSAGHAVHANHHVHQPPHPAHGSTDNPIETHYHAFPTVYVVDHIQVTVKPFDAAHPAHAEIISAKACVDGYR